jgi:hypothetical protein
MTEQDQQCFVKQIADAVIIATSEALRVHGIDPLKDLPIDDLCIACRREAKVAVAEILVQGKVLSTSGFGGWTATLCQIECAAAGRRAAESLLPLAQRSA